MMNGSNQQMNMPRNNWTGEVQVNMTEPYPETSGVSVTEPVQTLPGQTRPLEMNHGQPVEVIESPMSRNEVYLGSLKSILTRNKGHYMVASFLIGTSAPVSWEGILHEVGNDYIVIYQPYYDRYIIGDIYALKFIEFPQDAEQSCVGYRRRDALNAW